MIKDFLEYIKIGIVKKIKPDFERAKSLVKSAERKFKLFNENLTDKGITEENANDYVEYCYDMLMILTRAKMLVGGFNAVGFGAHEAEVSYLKFLGFNDSEIQFIDKMRFFRNGILYYGTLLDKEYAEKVIKFTKEIYKKIKDLMNKDF